MLRLWSGWDHRQKEAADVFAASVRRHASVKVDLRFLRLDDLPITRVGVTEFTYGRFCVPWYCGFEGRAVFADGCDMLCLGDVAELEAFDLQGRALAVVKHGGVSYPRPRSWSSLMLLDCSQLTCWPPQAVQNAPDDQLMRFGAFPEDQIGELPSEWNVLVQPGEEPPTGTRIAHWSALSDPNGGSWIDRSKSKIWAAARDRKNDQLAAA